MRFSSVFALVTYFNLPTAFAATYGLTDNWIGSAFLSAFVHENIPDPTNGRVTYVDQATALSQNLTYAQGNTFIIRADDTTVLSASGPGRNSIRVRSVNTYTTHVAVFDIAHMPEGCGTWPAVWETAETNWPNEGEVDIVEGVNDESPNSVSLHTSSNCTMPVTRAMTGTATGLNCDTYATGGQACGVSGFDTNTYGPPFNAAGGGWYAMERTNSFIKVWFWSRNAAKPGDIGAASVNTDNWGSPIALFPNTSCDIGAHFGPNNIIINLTFCGDWAGNVYSTSGCPSTCVDYVNNNPAAFDNAYFQFNSVRVYQ